jgi:hypothetical protein
MHQIYLFKRDAFTYTNVICTTFGCDKLNDGSSMRFFVFVSFLETRTRPDENAEEPGEEEDPLETLDSISELIRSELAQEKLEQEDFDRLTASKFVRKSTAILNKPDVPQGASRTDHCPQENTAKENHGNATNIVEQSTVQKKRRWKGDPVLRNLHQPTAARAEEEDAGVLRRNRR